MGQLKTFLQTAIEGALSVGVRIYFDRPEAVDTSIDRFMVVYLPSGIRNREVSGAKSAFNWSNCTVSFEVFVRDSMKAASPNEPAVMDIDELVDNLMSVFPIVDRTNDIVISTPRIVIPSSSDGNGFHYSRINASLTTAG